MIEQWAISSIGIMDIVVAIAIVVVVVSKVRHN